MRALRVTKILEVYDVPQLFLATDQFGSNIICMMIDFSQEIGFIYFGLQVSERKLKDFLLGEEDLRNLYVYPESDDAYFKVVVRNQIITAEYFPKNNVTEAILPTTGYYYEKDEEAEDYELITKTQQEQVTLLRLGFVDEYNSHDIDTECLARAISAFQHTVQNCHSKLKGKQSLIEAKLRVTAFQAASFDVEFKSASPLDLFGGSDLSDTLSKIDELMKTTDENAFMSVLNGIKGRTVSAYKNFIRILDENKLSVKYKWVSSIVDRGVVSTSINQERIDQIYELLNRSEELASEEIEYEGIFLASSVENGKWTLRTVSDEKTVNGESDNNSLLSGVTIERRRYRIRCRETQILNVATLKTENKIVLLSLEESHSGNESRM